MKKQLFSRGLRKTFAWGCMIRQEFTREFLERYDQILKIQRDNKKYRNKGLRQTTVKTIYGEVTFRTTIYEYVSDNGKNIFYICWIKTWSWVRLA